MEYWLSERGITKDYLSKEAQNKLVKSGGSMVIATAKKNYLKLGEKSNCSPLLCWISCINISLRYIDDETACSHLYSFWCHILGFDNSVYREIIKELSLWERYVWKLLDFCVEYDIGDAAPFEINMVIS